MLSIELTRLIHDLVINRKQQTIFYFIVFYIITLFNLLTMKQSSSGYWIFNRIKQQSILFVNKLIK